MTTKSAELSWRSKLGMILLATIAIYSSWQSINFNDITKFIRRFQKYNIIANDNISHLEQNLSCLRYELSAGEEIGFVSSLQGIERDEIFRGTQYALVPVIVIGEVEVEKFVAIYPGENSIQQAESEGYTILLDCHNGVGLLTHRENP